MPLNIDLTHQTHLYIHTYLLQKTFFKSSKLFQQEVPTFISNLCLWNAYLLFTLAARQPLRLLVCLKVLRKQKQIKHATRKYLRANTIYVLLEKITQEKNSVSHPLFPSVHCLCGPCPFIKQVIRKRSICKNGKQKLNSIYLQLYR